MRLAFKSGFWVGGVKPMLMSLTGGAFPGGRIAVPEDADEPREAGRRPPSSSRTTSTRSARSMRSSARATRRGTTSRAT